MTSARNPLPGRGLRACGYRVGGTPGSVSHGAHPTQVLTGQGVTAAAAPVPAASSGLRGPSPRPETPPQGGRGRPPAIEYPPPNIPPKIHPHPAPAQTRLRYTAADGHVSLVRLQAVPVLRPLALGLGGVFFIVATHCAGMLGIVPLQCAAWTRLTW